LKRHKSPGSDEILAELVQAGGEILCPKIHKPLNFIWNKEELPDQWKESIIAPLHKKSDKTDCSYYCEISLLSSTYILSNLLLPRISPYINKITGDISVGFDLISQLLIRSFAFIRYWRKMEVQ
jgi:hypothetical protein